MQEDEISRMLATNAAQKQYYEVASGTHVSQANGLSTRLRRSMQVSYHLRRKQQPQSTSVSRPQSNG